MPTPSRNIRVPDAVWDAAKARAAAEGTTVSALILDALKRYTAEEIAAAKEELRKSGVRPDEINDAAAGALLLAASGKRSGS